MSKLIVALDTSNFAQASDWVNKLRPEVEWFKIGLQLFLVSGTAANGQSMSKRIKDTGAKIFLDLKFHDIPNTVAGAVKSAAALGVDMVNVHASGGIKMMQTAVAARDEHAPDMILLGVTVLTSLSLHEMAELNMPVGHVEKLARMAVGSGLNGVIASAQELTALRPIVGDGLIVTPGIRPADSDKGDQARVATPAGAVQNGADYLVVGRAITQADDPLAAARAILDEMKEAKR
jgi:orotidine-5'-phosphate decarboxylase